MAIEFFWSLIFLSAFNFWDTPNFTYIKGFSFSFFLTFFSMCMTLVVLDNLCTTLQKKEGHSMH
jgi:hypothetical protein